MDKREPPMPDAPEHAVFDWPVQREILQAPLLPAFLTGYAEEEWRRIIVELYHRVTVVDVNALAAYCQAYARWRTAEEALATMAARDPLTNGLMIKTNTGSAVQNPIVATANKAARDMVRYAAEIGLTPAARKPKHSFSFK